MGVGRTRRTHGDFLSFLHCVLTDFYFIKSIKVQSSVLSHIAMSVVLGGQGKFASAKQEFDQAFLCDEDKHKYLLLLIKVPYHTDLYCKPSC